MVAKITVTEGEFAGWKTYDLHGTFDQVVGPFYFRPDPDGRMRCAFRAEPKHMNAGGRMHGGCLMTFADIALFQTAYQEMEGASGVTVQLDSTFIDGAWVGELVEATGEVHNFAAAYMAGANADPARIALFLEQLDQYALRASAMARATGSLTAPWAASSASGTPRRILAGVA